MTFSRARVATANSGSSPLDVQQRKLCGLLNRVTSGNYAIIYAKVQQCVGVDPTLRQLDAVLNQLAKMIVNKGCVELLFSSLYARICRDLVRSLNNTPSSTELGHRSSSSMVTHVENAFPSFSPKAHYFLSQVYSQCYGAIFQPYNSSREERRVCYQARGACILLGYLSRLELVPSSFLGLCFSEVVHQVAWPEEFQLISTPSSSILTHQSGGESQNNLVGLPLLSCHYLEILCHFLAAHGRRLTTPSDPTFNNIHPGPIEILRTLHRMLACGEQQPGLEAMIRVGHPWLPMPLQVQVVMVLQLWQRGWQLAEPAVISN
jgi:hypothetical protein